MEEFRNEIGGSHEKNRLRAQDLARLLVEGKILP